MTIIKLRDGAWDIGPQPGAAGPIQVEVRARSTYGQQHQRPWVSLTSGNRSFTVDLYTAELLLDILPTAIAAAKAAKAVAEKIQAGDCIDNERIDATGTGDVG